MSTRLCLCQLAWLELIELLSIRMQDSGVIHPPHRTVENSLAGLDHQTGDVAMLNGHVGVKHFPWIS